MREPRDCTLWPRATPEGGGAWVTIFVPDEHPWLRLKETLDWEAIRAVMTKHWRAAGKNVDGGPGRGWPGRFYVSLLDLMWVKAYHSRQMEEYVSESVVARRFLDLTKSEIMHVRDHASIARAEAALGAAGRAEVNAIIIGEAQRLGFAASTILSSDTTVQEPLIGYPNEPGILKGMAERIERALHKLKAGGVKVASAGITKAKEIYAQVKAHHLFAHTKEEKEKILARIVQQSETLMRMTKPVINQVSTRCLPVGRHGGRIKQQAAATLQRMVEVARALIPQIRYWMKTGTVASEKIIHAGITEARAIVKGRGRVKFGLKWLINRLTGGYLFLPVRQAGGKRACPSGRRVAARADENKMPEESLSAEQAGLSAEQAGLSAEQAGLSAEQAGLSAEQAGLKDYRDLFGPEATPAILVYDRGASLPAAAKACLSADRR